MRYINPRFTYLLTYLPVSLLGEQRHDGCEQFAYDCYPTASRLRFEPGPSAPESSTLTTRLPSHPISHYCIVNNNNNNNNNNNSIDNGRIISDVEGVVGDETCAGLRTHSELLTYLLTHSELVVDRCFQQVVSADGPLGDRFLHGANPLRSTRPLHLHTEAQSSTRI